PSSLSLSPRARGQRPAAGLASSACTKQATVTVRHAYPPRFAAAVLARIPDFSILRPGAAEQVEVLARYQLGPIPAVGNFTSRPAASRHSSKRCSGEASSLPYTWIVMRP